MSAVLFSLPFILLLATFATFTRPGNASDQFMLALFVGMWAVSACTHALWGGGASGWLLSVATGLSFACLYVMQPVSLVLVPIGVTVICLRNVRLRRVWVFGAILLLGLLNMVRSESVRGESLAEHAPTLTLVFIAGLVSLLWKMQDRDWGQYSELAFLLSHRRQIYEGTLHDINSDLLLRCDDGSELPLRTEDAALADDLSRRLGQRVTLIAAPQHEEQGAGAYRRPGRSIMQVNRILNEGYAATMVELREKLTHEGVPRVLVALACTYGVVYFGW